MFCDRISSAQFFIVETNVLCTLKKPLTSGWRQLWNIWKKLRGDLTSFFSVKVYSTNFMSFFFWHFFPDFWNLGNKSPQIPLVAPPLARIFFCLHREDRIEIIHTYKVSPVTITDDLSLSHRYPGEISQLFGIHENRPLLSKLHNFSYRNCRLASFLFVFGYLLFFRTCHYIGLPIPPAHCNAIQLMVTIRVSLIESLHKTLSNDGTNCLQEVW